MELAGALRIWGGIRLLLKELCRLRYPEEAQTEGTTDDQLKAALLLGNPSRSIVLAIDECFAFRQAWAATPSAPTPVDYYELSQAIGSLLAWFEKLGGGLDEAMAAHVGIIVELCKTRQRLEECERELGELQLAEDAEFMQESAVDAPAAAAPSAAPPSAVTAFAAPAKAAVGEARSFESYRTTHKEKLKGARIRIVDGKYEGKEAVFVSWNGTSVWVKVVGVDGKVSVPEKRRAAVLEWPR